jgi:DNA repair protein RadC
METSVTDGLEVWWQGQAMLVRTAQDAVNLLSPFFADRESEGVAVLHLTGEGRLLATTFSEAGGVDEVELPIRDILAAALRMGADAFIVAHNHPSGDASPSEADIAATRRLGEAARSAGLRLFDHLIFAGGEFRSLREMGLL